MWSDAALILSMAIIISALMIFYAWVWNKVREAYQLKRHRLYQIQKRLRSIHEVLAYGDTTMPQRQTLFTEMYDLLDERRNVLRGR
jgi:hypothetical protein